MTRFITIMFACLLALAGPASAGSGSFQLASEDGSRWISPGAFGGKPTVFLFWDTECSACLLELSKVEKLRKAFPLAVFVAASLSPRGDARRVLGQYKVPTDIVRAQAPANPRGLLASIGNRIGALPFSAAFDGEGQLCASGIGALTHERVKIIAQACR